MRPSTRARALRAALASIVAACVILAPLLAEARAGRGGSFGSRGARTYQAAPPTPTAPRVAPIQRSQTPQPAAQPSRPGVATPLGQPRPSFFQRHPFLGGMMGGLLGAGLIGMLFGGGFGAFHGMAGFLGLLLQIGLILLVVRLVMGFLRSRRSQEPAYGANAPGAVYRDAEPGAGYDAPRRGAGGAPLGSGDTVGLEAADFDAFEQRLGEVQAAWSAADAARLERLATPEMVDYFREQLDELRREGLVNRVEDVKLLQGDLAEAWREDGREYATVAMRWSASDVTQEAATGRIVEGNPHVPVEAREAWTFVRTPGGPWMLSAIQQT